jgi:hypothetical protein
MKILAAGRFTVRRWGFRGYSYIQKSQAIYVNAFINRNNRRDLLKIPSIYAWMLMYRTR